MTQRKIPHDATKIPHASIKTMQPNQSIKNTREVQVLPNPNICLFWITIFLLKLRGSRARGLSNCGHLAWLACGIRDLSSLARGGSHVPCIPRQIFNHWTTTEVSLESLEKTKTHQELKFLRRLKALERGVKPHQPSGICGCILPEDTG